MNFNLDKADKQLLADKLIQLYTNNKNIEVKKFFDQYKIVLDQFDININYINNKQDLQELDNILLIQLDGLGNCILASAFFRELRNNYPNAKIDIISDSQYIDIFNNCPYLNEVIPFDNQKNQNANDVILFCRDNLWNIQYDLAINLNWEYIQSAALLNFLSFSKNRLSYRSNEYERYCCDLVYDREVYAQRYYLDQFLYTHIIDNPYDMYSEKERKLWILSILNKDIKSNKLEAWYSDEDLNYVKQFISTNKKNVLLSIGGSEANIHYPVKDLAEAINEISDDNHYIIIDKADSHSEANKLNELLNKDSINIVNKLNLNQLSALISLSDLYIGNFSGIVHLIEALNKPMIVLLKEAIETENDHPGYLSIYNRYKPMSDNVIILRPEYCIENCIEIPVIGGCCEDHPHCISQILPEEIITAYTELM